MRGDVVKPSVVARSLLVLLAAPLFAEAPLEPLSWRDVTPAAQPPLRGAQGRATITTTLPHATATEGLLGARVARASEPPEASRAVGPLTPKAAAADDILVSCDVEGCVVQNGLSVTIVAEPPGDAPRPHGPRLVLR